jgi:hypothetical protein
MNEPDRFPFVDGHDETVSIKIGFRHHEAIKHVCRQGLQQRAQGRLVRPDFGQRRWIVVTK